MRNVLQALGTSLAGTVEDMYRWLEEGRYDILQYCSARMNDGSVICGAELDVTDLGDVHVVDLWKAPDGSSLTACPFLSFDTAGLPSAQSMPTSLRYAGGSHPIHGIITRPFLTARHTGRRRGGTGSPDRTDYRSLVPGPYHRKNSVREPLSEDT